MSSDTDHNTQYVQQIIGWQPRLYAFVLSLTGNTDEADDVLQNTNVVLLQKQAAFRSDANFGAWAMQIAYLEVKRHRQGNARAKRRFDDVLLEHLAAGASTIADEPGNDLQALRECMRRLSPLEREMLAFRYGGNPLRVIAEKLGRSVGSVSQTLYRIRGKLDECIQTALNSERRDGP
jgi:RNA polymerase sigma-70 factor, ECF subfamily